jgi:hypothetical protein
VVEFWWRRLREVETGKGRRLGVIIFRGEEGEVARQLHSAGGRRLVKSGAAAGVWRSKMTKENWVGGPNARLGRTADWAREKKYG